MFSIKNLAGCCLFLAIIVAALILMPHGMNQPVNAQVADAGLTVTPHTVTVGTCTRSGTYTQKFVHNPSARSSYTTHWSPGLPELALGYQITVDGYGYVQASINYNVGSDTGSYTWPPLKVGSWGHRGALSLWAPYATRVTAYTASPPDPLSFARIDNHAYGTYNWSSSGTITLQAKYCKRTGPYWCEWEDLGSPGSESFSGSGNWTLTRAFVCPNCSQDVPYTNYHRKTCNMTRYSRGTYSGCGASYWSCNPSDVRKHRTVSCDGDKKYRICTGHYCFEFSRRIPAGETCAPAADTDDDSDSSTTTSPTVSSGGGGGGTVSSGGGTGGSDTRVRCGNGSSCSRGGYASSREAHKTTCPAGHRYYGCYRTSWHDRCRAPSSGEVQCGNSGCNRGGVASSRTAHKTTCRRGHTYWSCNRWLSRIHRRH